jgi:hypothetical protein
MRTYPGRNRCIQFGPCRGHNLRGPLGWWESKGLEPLFIDPKGPEARTDCDFQVWSWTAFVHWMPTDPATGLPCFLILPTYDDLASGDALRAKAGPRTLVLKPRNPKPKSMNLFEQAGRMACSSTRMVVRCITRPTWI